MTRDRYGRYRKKTTPQSIGQDATVFVDNVIHKKAEFSWGIIIFLIALMLASSYLIPNEMLAGYTQTGDLSDYATQSDLDNVSTTSSAVVVAGNPFNQDLDTTDDVTFNDITVSDDFTVSDYIIGLFGGSIDLRGDPWYLGGVGFQVAENLTVDHNITAENVFLPAYIRIGSRSTIPVSVSGVWENVTFNNSVAGLSEGFTHTYSDSTNDTITVVNSGIYSISYFIACEDSAVTPDAHVGFRLINATDQTIIKGSYGEFDTGKKDKHVFKEHVFITSFIANDPFKVQFTADDTTVTMTPHVTHNPSGPSCQLSIHKIANL